MTKGTKHTPESRERMSRSAIFIKYGWKLLFFDECDINPDTIMRHLHSPKALKLTEKGGENNIQVTV